MAKTKAKAGAGELTEQLTIQSPTPVAVSVSSVNRATNTATATTASAHGYTSGDFVSIAGADQAEYNGEVQVTVTGVSTFTYPVAGSPVTPATGTITATFVSDAQGGQGSGWHLVAVVWGSVLALSAAEVLQAQAINSTQTYSVKIYKRPNITPKMRILWTPYLDTIQKTLEIHSVLPDNDEPRRFLILNAGELV